LQWLSDMEIIEEAEPENVTDKKDTKPLNPKISQ